MSRYLRLLVLLVLTFAPIGAYAQSSQSPVTAAPEATNSPIQQVRTVGDQGLGFFADQVGKLCKPACDRDQVVPYVDGQLILHVDAAIVQAKPGQTLNMELYEGLFFASYGDAGVEAGIVGQAGSNSPEQFGQITDASIVIVSLTPLLTVPTTLQLGEQYDNSFRIVGPTLFASLPFVDRLVWSSTDSDCGMAISQDVVYAYPSSEKSWVISGGPATINRCGSVWIFGRYPVVLNG